MIKIDWSMYLNTNTLQGYKYKYFLNAKVFQYKYIGKYFYYF